MLTDEKSAQVGRTNPASLQSSPFGAMTTRLKACHPNSFVFLKLIFEDNDRACIIDYKKIAGLTEQDLAHVLQALRYKKA
ncbi:hypothetical protein [Pedobacter endophyticus]|uniref:Uncharacterized protein n=1 Tax=Pedobacter endophyticus TaxID=2789740 RepID=A0A7S9L338_9SPHI|nr:hypothetical protein [Pedobacter endophyticus]QPH41607.1 hypothetical protein IZT61_10280 [Pedobacter endophyticus]